MSSLPCGDLFSRAISFSRAIMSIFDRSSPKVQGGSVPLIEDEMSDRLADRCDLGHGSKTWVKTKNPASEAVRREREERVALTVSGR
jgi:hypothetical protein